MMGLHKQWIAATIRRAGRFASASGLAAIMFAGLALAPMFPASAEPALAAPSASDTAPTVSEYTLDTGDKVKVTVYGEDDLSGEYDVDGSGNVRLPLIGQVKAAGLTQHEFESAVEAQLAQGYLVNPKVSVEVTNYRPFTILGEVNKPGEYPFENGMTVLNAVALAGGYTYRADQSTVYVRRKGSLREESAPADDRTQVFPGDTVRVDERIF
jgi:protein involved in polysaccharide export with SLBB domain